jgi:hypothetical protein
VEVDTPVLVRNDQCQGWLYRHFAHWGEDGRMCCWSYGRSDWTSLTRSTEAYCLWKLPDEAE